MKKDSNPECYDLIIIGEGVTGLGAAIYAGRFRLKTLVIGKERGGLITWTDDVSNYPGFKKVTGNELVENIRDHALDYDIDIVTDNVEKIVKNDKGFDVKTKEKTYLCPAVLLATGTKVRELGVEGEQEFKNKGVSYCALCDAPLFKDKVVAVVGGSDSAAKDALILADHAKKVYIIYRGEKIKPEPVNYERVLANKKIEIITNTNVTKITGDKLVTGVTLDTPYKEKNDLELGGVFIAIGHIALSSLAKDLGVKLNNHGEVMINRKSETNIPGFYAAGDVADTEFKQAITGVAEGVSATYSAYHYITSEHIMCAGDEEK